MGNSAGNNFKVWPLMPDELAPPEPPQHRTSVEDDTIINYGSGEFTFGLQNLSQQEESANEIATNEELSKSQLENWRKTGLMSSDPRQSHKFLDHQEEQVNNQSDGISEKFEQIENNLDAIVPKYLLMQLMQTSEEKQNEQKLRQQLEQEIDQLERLSLQQKDEHQLLSLFEVEHNENGDYSNDEEALNNFDFLDYLKIAADEGFSGYGHGRGSHHHEPPAPHILR